jgi:hypothetical protein
MSRARWIPSVVLTAALLALGGAGCGGGKEQVTAAELVQKGDQICRDEQSKFKEIQSAPLVNASDGADQADALHDAAQNAVDSLRDLEPPQAQRDAYGRYLDAKENTLQYFDKGKDAADERDGRAYSEAQAAVAAGAPERASLAKSLGFKVCSQGPGTGFAAG